MLPHEGVWARIGPSRIHGVGAIAIRAIARGTNVFANDQRDIIWLPMEAIAALPANSPERRFYEDFGIRAGALIGCPAHFDLLSVGWYCNEPAPGEDANLEVTGDFQMIAARDIAAGEELTVLYASFSRAD
ncbi:hypothetical protein [Sphingomonas crusticola]|uniref:hypothetical protein n=1 Tax=Sphingomonas crusticola TaxID=1697973 RepID=UPI000E2485B3|nr:hypothetical protein [Sphingomonas crusticola]